jgi:hypothetical protein
MTKLTQEYLDQRAAELYPAELCTNLEVWIELGITTVEELEEWIMDNRIFEI